MPPGVYIAAPEGESGQSSIALGLVDLFTRSVGRVGVFRPVTKSAELDELVELLLAHSGMAQSYGDAIGVTYAAIHDDPETALSLILSRFHHLSTRFDILLVLGSDYTDVSTTNELAFNAKVAANLGTPVVLVVHGRGRTPEQIRLAADLARAELTSAHAHLIAVVANRVDPEDLARVRAVLSGDGTAAVSVVPEVPVLAAPTVLALQEACGGTLLQGNPVWLDRESLGFVVAAMSFADIEISSAATAAQFGIEPRVAMLSYSTGSSSTGADEDKVRRAAEIVRRRRPDLWVEGPIQYDAAVHPGVAAAKLPDSEVAGRATVLIFPDLNTGNNTYKALQRSAGAVAIGPVLQGLNKPVNDLSRGALVEDIVNTVAITAIPAAEDRAPAPTAQMVAN